ncbi:MAG: type II toxin-antitoxin system RelE/ParE family toxin [Burkholderiales bacterium]
MKPGLFDVVYTAKAQGDLFRLYRHLLDQARYVEDLARAESLIGQLREHIEGRLSRTPYLYRHAAGDLQLRELVIAVPAGGYVALNDIPNASQVTVIAVRHQLEDDYL